MPINQKKITGGIMEKLDEIRYRQVYLNIPYHVKITEMYLQEALTALLYHKGDLSLKQARAMLGQSRREFEEITLSKFGYTTMDNCPDNVEIELKASQR